MEAVRLGGCGSLVLVLDTSFLLDIARGLIPISMIDDVIERSYTPIIPAGVVRELESMSQMGGLKSRLAGRALEILKNINAIIYDVDSRNVDEAIASLALSLKSNCNVIVATNDKALRKLLRSLGIPSMYYRKARGGLEIEWSPL